MTRSVPGGTWCVGRPGGGVRGRRWQVLGALVGEYGEYASRPRRRPGAPRQPDRARFRGRRLRGTTPGSGLQPQLVLGCEPPRHGQAERGDGDEQPDFALFGVLGDR
ncbi:hypothetical protein ACGFZL_28560 [Streptomyces sp. NPDC048182]|uniref:hypothetical protein n=1 Tax=Streptomyces sp. NPDC048182 TaxID=3365507 RepID=UPI00371E9D02